MNYPESRREEIVDEIHGEKVADPYRWLEDFSNTEVQQWLDQQHTLTEEIFNKIPNREQSTERIRELLDLGLIFPPKKKYISVRKKNSANRFFS